MVLEKAFWGACILFLVLYHLNDIFCHLAAIRLRAAPRGGPGTGDCFGIQCTLTVCWSSLAACSASALLPLGGIGNTRCRIHSRRMPVRRRTRGCSRTARALSCSSCVLRFERKYCRPRFLRALSPLTVGRLVRVCRREVRGFRVVLQGGGSGG